MSGTSDTAIDTKKRNIGIGIGVTIAVIIIIAIISVIIYYSVSNNTSKSCLSDNDCSENSICYSEQCKLIPGALCSNNSDCASGSCVDNICKNINGDKCTSDSDCGLNSTCDVIGENKSCKGGPGSPCDQGSDCTSLICQKGTCRILQGNKGCFSDDVCYIGTGCVDGVCIESRGIGSNCSSNEDCNKGICKNGICLGSLNYGDSCNNSENICKEGLQCISYDRERESVEMCGPGFICTCGYYDGINTYDFHNNVCPEGSVLTEDNQCKGNKILSQCYKDSQCINGCNNWPQGMYNIKSINLGIENSRDLPFRYNPDEITSQTNLGNLHAEKILYVKDVPFNSMTIDVIYILTTINSVKTVFAMYNDMSTSENYVKVVEITPASSLPTGYKIVDIAFNIDFFIMTTNNVKNSDGITIKTLNINKSRDPGAPLQSLTPNDFPKNNSKDTESYFVLYNQSKFVSKTLTGHQCYSEDDGLTYNYIEFQTGKTSFDVFRVDESSIEGSFYNIIITVDNKVYTTTFDDYVSDMSASYYTLNIDNNSRGFQASLVGPLVFIANIDNKLLFKNLNNSNLDYDIYRPNINSTIIQAQSFREVDDSGVVQNVYICVLEQVNYESAISSNQFFKLIKFNLPSSTATVSYIQSWNISDNSKVNFTLMSGQLMIAAPAGCNNLNQT